MVQGGQMNLKMIADRKKEFTGPISVQLLFKPPGMEAAGNVDIPAGKDEAIYPINASDGAADEEMEAAGCRFGDHNGPDLGFLPFCNGWKSPPPFVTGKIETAPWNRVRMCTMTAGTGCENQMGRKGQG